MLQLGDVPSGRNQHLVNRYGGYFSTLERNVNDKIKMYKKEKIKMYKVVHSCYLYLRRDSNGR